MAVISRSLIHHRRAVESVTPCQFPAIGQAIDERQTAGNQTWPLKRIQRNDTPMKLSKDQKEFVELLNSKKVKYVLVGGHAVLPKLAQE
jgi:hypothetical protein